MPEIAEVARAVHYLKKHLVGRTLAKVTAIEDANVFGKVGTSHTAIMKSLTGKKVLDAGQQGKYFWLIMSSPPHPVLHFGMAGWLKFKSEHTFYYRKKDDEPEQWPPKYWKVIFETDGKGEERIEAAYVDLRRFGRVRLVDCPGKDIRKHSPLVENGPDPVQDKDVVTFEWLKELCERKKVPIKAMLLDQANISGIGNWVGDEIMYHAKMHPEQYANTLSEDQIRQLHKSLHYICGTAVDLLADSDQFPEEWLFKHRWGKGKKDAANKLPNGEKIVFLTVGGRTSAVVPSVQKKTGPVAKEMSEAESDVEKPKKDKPKKAAQKPAAEKTVDPPKSRSKKRANDQREDEVDSELAPKRTSKKIKTEEEAPKKASKKVKEEQEDSPAESRSRASTKTNGTTKAKAASKAKIDSKKAKKEIKEQPTEGRRKSTRLK